MPTMSLNSWLVQTVPVKTGIQTIEAIQFTYDNARKYRF